MKQFFKFFKYTYTFAPEASVNYICSREETVGVFFYTLI